jgi:hypothetical protein
MRGLRLTVAVVVVAQEAARQIIGEPPHCTVRPTVLEYVARLVVDE